MKTAMAGGTLCEAVHPFKPDADNDASKPVMVRMSKNDCDWGSERWMEMEGQHVILGLNGRGFVNVLYECWGPDEIAATTPAGYRSTTPQVQQVPARDGLQTTVLFGFKHEK